MAKHYIDNLSEETRKGMLEKARSGIYPSYAPIGYRNTDGPGGKPSSFRMGRRPQYFKNCTPVSLPGHCRWKRWWRNGRGSHAAGPAAGQEFGASNPAQAAVHGRIRLGRGDLPREP
jgi:hypothetical protein